MAALVSQMWLLLLLLLAVVPTSGALNDVVRQTTAAHIAGFVASKDATAAMLRRVGGAAKTANGGAAGGPARRAYSPSSAIRFHVDIAQVFPLSGSPVDSRSDVETRAALRFVDEILPVALAEVQLRVALASPVQGSLRLAPACESRYVVPSGCTPGANEGCAAYCASVVNSERNPGSCRPTGAKHKWDYFGPYEICDSTLACTTYPGETTPLDIAHRGWLEFHSELNSTYLRLR